MALSYLYGRRAVLPFLRGYLPFYTKSQVICPVAAEKEGKQLVWRTEFEETFKMSKGYADKPVELGNFLFLRTREKEMLHTRLHKKSESVKFDNFLTTGSDRKNLTKIEGELEAGFQSLHEIFTILKANGEKDFPVSFASNTLYAMEKNGLRDQKIYEDILFPILKKKAKYLHSEGLAGSIWALGQYQCTDANLISRILDTYDDKSFGTDVVYVDNAPFTNETFLSQEGAFSMELSSTKEFTNMFFKNHITCLELFEGLKNLSNQTLESKASGRVAEVLSDLESRQQITSDSYWFYKQISGGAPAPATS